MEKPPLEKPKWIVGIDEAGRGPLAGPVAVGAACYRSDDATLLQALNELFPKVKDSKQLSEKRREAIYESLATLVASTTLTLRVALIPATTIDDEGIVPAIRMGIREVTDALDPFDSVLLLDGGLVAPDIFGYQETYIRGDATYLPIALASIAAKVTRDRHMRQLAELYPAYGFDVHKGYGTKAHYQALKEKGMSTVHRKSFIHLS